MGKGSGYAKVILFGEHFVVYGLPAIGVALAKKTDVEVSKSQHMRVESSHADASLLNGLEAIKNAMGIKDSFVVKIKSEIPLGSGLGSSAAVSVAYVRALADEYGLQLTGEQISAYAYEAEKVYHGTPSGIDNTLASSGGAIFYQNTDGKSAVKPLNVGKPLNIVIGNTGKKQGSTAEIIAAVRGRREKNPGIYEDLFNAERKVIDGAVKAIEHGDPAALGELMNINHGLLSAMGVSTKENGDIIYAARVFGAYGAKITGAGMGGSCVILAKNEKNAEDIANEIRKMGYLAITSVVQ